MTRQVEKINKYPPVHPGKTIQRQFFAPLNLNIEEAAQALKIPAYQLQDLIEGKSKIDLEMAYRLGRYFQIEPELFLNLQQRYDFEVWKDLTASKKDDELTKKKYRLSQTITRYQIKKNLSEEEIAERLELDKTNTAKLLRGYVETFSLGELVNLLGKLHTFEFRSDKAKNLSTNFFISSIEEVAKEFKITLGSKMVKEIEKLKLVSELRELRDELKEIYKRDRKNITEMVKCAKKIASYLEKLEKMCNPAEEKTDLELLKWVKEEKPRYKRIIFRSETVLKKLRSFNSELLIARVDNEKGKGHLFVLFENVSEFSKAQEQFLLLEKLSSIISESTDENGNCDFFMLFDALWKIAYSSAIPFTYAFVPEGEEAAAINLLFNALGNLTAEQLKEIHLSKRKAQEKERYFSFRTDKSTSSPNFFYTDPFYQGTRITS